MNSQGNKHVNKATVQQHVPGKSQTKKKKKEIICVVSPSGVLTRHLISQQLQFGADKPSVSSQRGRMENRGIQKTDQK